MQVPTPDQFTGEDGQIDTDAYYESLGAFWTRLNDYAPDQVGEYLQKNGVTSVSELIDKWKAEGNTMALGDVATADTQGVMQAKQVYEEGTVYDKVMFNAQHREDGYYDNYLYNAAKAGEDVPVDLTAVSTSLLNAIMDDWEDQREKWNDANRAWQL